MKTKINRNLYFAILDAFEHQIRYHEKEKKHAVGLAIQALTTAQRQGFVEMAEHHGGWEVETYTNKKAFMDEFEPDM